MNVKARWRWGLGAIGIAMVTLLAIVAYALLKGEDGSEPQVARPAVSPSVVTETEAERRTRLCEAALQGGDRLGILMFCSSAPTPTPSLPTPSIFWRQWCWAEKAVIAFNQIIVDYNKTFGGFDYRQQEEDLIEAQRKFEANCSRYLVAPARSGDLDQKCQQARDTEYTWRRDNVDSYWTGKLEDWQKEYCR